jgi:hypothetical protein
MNMNRIVWLLSHDEVNLYLAPGLGNASGLYVRTRFLIEGLPDNCQALIVDLDSVAPDWLSLAWLVKELNGRPHPYPVVAFGYSLWDDQIKDLQAAGILVFPHGLVPAVFEAIVGQTSHAPCDKFPVLVEEHAATHRSGGRPAGRRPHQQDHEKNGQGQQPEGTKPPEHDEPDDVGDSWQFIDCGMNTIEG